jgi:uncharacterized protein (DUF2147 family)
MNVEPNSVAALAGSAFDPQRNLNYRLNISLSATRMTTRGCVLGGLLCKNRGWARLSAKQLCRSS